MTAATLRDVLRPGRAVAGLVCLGWEDARAYVAAAEAEDLPVILQAGPGARRHMPLALWGTMLRGLADAAAVPVVVHLDHGESLDVCRAAIEAGFSSVMYDGSHDPLEKNISDTAEVAHLARGAGASSEGEIGVVGYAGGAASAATDPGDAARFAAETAIDALAVSVGNLHLMEDGEAALDWASLAAIEAATATPLVLHGGSGISEPDQRKLAAETSVAKINIGTELRQAYGRALRRVLSDDPRLFDRVAIHDAVAPDLVAHTRRVLRRLAGH